MEQLVKFNGVNVLLTTGQSLSEVQSYLDRADVVVSVHLMDCHILWQRASVAISPTGERIR